MLTFACSNPSLKSMGLIRTNLMRHASTVLAINTVLCCLIILFSTREFILTPFYYGVALVDFAVFVGWLIWASYILCAKKILSPMDAKAYTVLEWVNNILFIYWVLSRFVRAISGWWIVPIITVIWLFSISYTLINCKHRH